MLVHSSGSSASLTITSIASRSEDTTKGRDIIRQNIGKIQQFLFAIEKADVESLNLLCLTSLLWK